MTFQRICARKALVCLPLLACAAEKADADSFAVTTPLTAAETTITSAGAGSSTGTTADVGTSTTASTASTGEPMTEGGTTLSGTSGATTAGDETFGVDTTTDATDTTGTTGDDGSTGPAGLSWAVDVYPVVIEPACGCHAKDWIGGLWMKDAETAYMNLVDRPSVNSNLDRVEPGDPDASLALHLMRGTQDQGEGFTMPFGGEMLPKDKIDLFEQWILEGALP